MKLPDSRVVLFFVESKCCGCQWHLLVESPQRSLVIQYVETHSFLDSHKLHLRGFVTKDLDLTSKILVL